MYLAICLETVKKNGCFCMFSLFLFFLPTAVLFLSVLRIFLKQLCAWYILHGVCRAHHLQDHNRGPCPGAGATGTGVARVLEVMVLGVLA